MYEGHYWHLCAISAECNRTERMANPFYDKHAGGLGLGAVGSLGLGFVDLVTDSFVNVP